MFIVPLLIALAALVFFCWLLFSLASYALPFYVGLKSGIRAFEGGAGLIGSALIGIFAAGVTLGLGQILLVILPWTWARVSVVMLFVAPAATAGYYATHGLLKHIIPSEPGQVILSLFGAIAVGIATWLRILGDMYAWFDPDTKRPNK